jgi:ABC-type enterobactin transport system permease subunit
MVTVPGTLFPVVSRSVNVSIVPAGDELIVAGSRGWLKAAVTSFPVTTLFLPLVLVGTFVALLLGLEEAMVRSVLAPPLGSPPLPPPQAGSATDRSNAKNRPKVVEEPRFVIVIVVSM